MSWFLKKKKTKQQYDLAISLVPKSSSHVHFKCAVMDKWMSPEDMVSKINPSQTDQTTGVHMRGSEVDGDGCATPVYLMQLDCRVLLYVTQ